MTATVATPATAGRLRATAVVAWMVVLAVGPRAADVTAITGADIIPMTSAAAVLDNHAIVVENGRVPTLCPAASG